MAGVSGVAGTTVTLVVSAGVFTSTSVLGVITIGPELTALFSSFLASGCSVSAAFLAVLELRASAAPRARSSTKLTVFLRHLASPRTNLV